MTAPPSPLEDLLSDLERFVDAGTADADGFITCSLPPWASEGCLGRITDFPKDKPPSQRSITLKCALHDKCTTAPRKRRVISDRMLLFWLYSVKLERFVSRDRSAELTAEHNRQFAIVIDGLRARGSGGSAASSSGLPAAGGA